MTQELPETAVTNDGGPNNEPPATAVTNDGGPNNEPPAPAAVADAITLDPSADWSKIAQPNGHHTTFTAARDLEIRRTGKAFTSTETLRAGDVRVIGWREGETLDARAV